MGFVFFTISLDSQSYRSSTYKLWKVQESLNKQGEGGPGPRGLRLPWQASLPQHSTAGAVSPLPFLPVHRPGVPVSCGPDLWAVGADGLSQLRSWQCHSGCVTGAGFSAVTSERISIFPFFLDMKTSCWAGALMGGGTMVSVKCSPGGV